MIEFKAECGHTVRAKDEDAGGVVRCSYCGRTANVPDMDDDDLDFLFQDVEREKAGGETAVRKKRPAARGIFFRRRTKEFDPFAVILRLCYAALLIIIVIVVGRKFVVPLFKEGGVARRIVSRTQEAPQKRQRDNAAGGEKPKTHRPGLIAREKLTGLYVDSTPPGATGYYINSSRAPETGRIYLVKETKKFTVGVPCPNLADGTYVVEVAFRWNHRNLVGFPDYASFRRSIQRAPQERRRQLVAEYFIPDGASSVFVDETDEQIYIVRQYLDIVVRKEQPKGIQALFLPKVMKSDGVSLSIEELVTNYLPDEEAYVFDEGHVLNELDFHGVVTADRPFVLEALARVGVIPYVTPDKRTLLFKIGIQDGAFAAKVLDEPGR